MLKAVKIRLYPTDEQVVFINKQLGCCRVVYNECLAYRKESYEKEHKSISPSDAIKHIVDLKQEKEWLKEVHSKVLQQSVRDMNRAYDNFFRLYKGYPKFKAKKDNNQSCRFPKDAFIGIRGNRIDLIRALRDVHFKCSVKDEKYLNKNQDKISSLTLRKMPSGKIYLSVLIDKPNELRQQQPNRVGIDLGVKDFIATSEGEIFENLHFKKSQTDKIKRLQKQLSRKQKESKNHNKLRIKLARLYEKITNKKQYYLHQITNTLINENQVICMEDLNVKGMLRNHKLAESIQEMNFGEFRRMLEYKAKWYGRKIVFVDRFYPSSKTCNYCGYIKKDLKLSDRQWRCTVCGEVLDRDYNAALNILDEGLRIIGLSSPEFTLVDYPPMDDRLSNKVLKSSDRLKQERNEFH
jgi:putative transposase